MNDSSATPTLDPPAARNAPLAPERNGGHFCCTRLLDLGVRLGGTTILEGINLHVHCGELTAIIGPNGAGKTTLLRAILGETRHSGQLIFRPSASPDQPQRPRLGYVPQRLEFDRGAPLTVLDLFAVARGGLPVWLGASARTRLEARAALDHVGGAGLLNRRLGHLSCGQLQRVLLALALTPMPQLLLLDEPLAGLDRAGTAQFYEIVSGLRHSLDLSILLVSHDLQAAAAIADRMVFIHERTIRAEGPPAAVLSQPLVRDCFGLDLPAAEGARCGEKCCAHYPRGNADPALGSRA